MSEIKQILAQCNEEFEKGLCMKVRCNKCKISDSYKEVMNIRIEEVG